jgi:hypothetical protein
MRKDITYTAIPHPLPKTVQRKLQNLSAQANNYRNGDYIKAEDALPYERSIEEINKFDAALRTVFGVEVTRQPLI